jgi:hypothetical protein
VRKRERRSWEGIISRCEDKTNRHFINYGGRGIKVCEAWRSSFEQFLEDIGPCPSSNHSIDRIDNDGNYEPGNVRWATKAEQANNRRTNVHIYANGLRLTVAQWSRRLGIDYKTLRYRLRHMPAEQALFDTSADDLPTQSLENPTNDDVRELAMRVVGMNRTSLRQFLRYLSEMV